MYEPNAYSAILELFLHLRGKGISVSAADLDIILTWEEDKISPKFLQQVLIEHAAECKKRAKTFPQSLLPIARKVRAIINKLSEV